MFSVFGMSIHGVVFYYVFTNIWKEREWKERKKGAQVVMIRDENVYLLLRDVVSN